MSPLVLPPALAKNAGVQTQTNGAPPDEAPAGPCGPTGPCGPCGPVAPCGPCEPVGPCGPCGPTRPNASENVCSRSSSSFPQATSSRKEPVGTGDGRLAVTTPVCAMLLTTEFKMTSGDPATRTFGAARCFGLSRSATVIVNVLAT